MYVKKTSLMVCLMYFFFFIWVFSVQAQTGGDDLRYQKRTNDGDNYYEGIKSKPLSAYDIELVSALVNYGETTSSLPEQFKIKYYLKSPANVYLTVQELDNKYFYWLDKTKSGKAGFDNTFEWPTNKVIQYLGINIYDLGIVARLNRAEPGIREEVAPVIFYHLQSPANIKEYLFTFKTSGDAYLWYTIYKKWEEKPYSEIFSRKSRGGRPFTIRWSAGTEEGFFDLVIKGYFLDTNYPIGQTVSFYHQPKVKE